MPRNATLAAASGKNRHRQVFSPHLHRIKFVRCPVVVQLLSSRCPVNDWTTTGQQLDNDWTTNEEGAYNPLRYSELCIIEQYAENQQETQKGRFSGKKDTLRCAARGERCNSKKLLKKVIHFYSF